MQNSDFGLEASAESASARDPELFEILESASPTPPSSTMAEETHRSRQAAPGASVIICCHNSATRLPETLKYLSCQKMPTSLRWEVVVVDNNSDDDTAQFAASEWERLGSPTSLKVVTEPTPGQSAARAAGVRKSSYEYLIMCDDDNWLHPDYLHRAHQRLSEQPEIGVLGGRNFAAFTGSAPDWFEKEQMIYAVGPQGERTGDISDRMFIFGAGMALRKSVWELLADHGYRSFLTGRKARSLSSGDDSEICLWHLLAGYSLFYDEGMILEHHIESSRLNRAYLKRLKATIHESNAYLKIYQSLIKSAPNNRSYMDMARGIFYLISGVWSQLYSKCSARSKFTKAQIAFGTKLVISKELHAMLVHYSVIANHKTSPS